ncbi:CCA tRNA nucleotidyltransferase [Nitrincola lacisaponensis]
MEICLVGGAVRDELLGLEVKDRDWVVTGATPEQMLAQGFRPVGKDFPVFINPHTGEEYALARTERKSGHGYQGFTFHAHPDVTLEEDLLRRDLTINAMARRPDGSLVDPYQGQDDLEQRVLRHVSPAFAEDPLRVLRVARFMARFTPLGFQVAPETLALMQQISASGELQHLSAERVWMEFERALSCDHPLVFLQCLQQAQALPVLLPEFNPLDWNSAQPVLDRLNREHPCAEQRFALLCHLAMPEEAPLEAVKTLCERLKTPNRFLQAATDLLQWHDTLASLDTQESSRRLALVKALKLLRNPERLQQLLAPTHALHPDMPDDLGPRFEQRLAALAQVSSAEFMQQGLQGKALGNALEARYLALLESL